MSLIQDLQAGNRLALARALTQVENDTPAGRDILDTLFAFTGKAHLVGITGSPGTGKSSLANQLARIIRQSGGNPLPQVAILAVDPSSPFSGGALLGDRIRMRDISVDPGVFIRSMASRGELGGLARTTSKLVQVLDAAGFNWILIETVGAGQSEVEVARLAHTTIVVEAPGLGDDIQAIKAGILEIADILVVNKADLAGAENTERSLRANLDLNEAEVPGGKEKWKPLLLRTEATRGIGIEAVVEGILAHRAFLERTGAWNEREHLRLKTELDSSLHQELFQQWENTEKAKQYQAVLEKVFEHKISPAHAAQDLIKVK